ncbi:MAG: hypothetical protein OXU66_01110 [Gammaproteobacteria bacterium]|nr:hypothetical protein [Gammaproteobacteria bacterium]MDD9895468.1 hypothetical protein [Gammaproteobacteria bacterium]MDD9957515.1 hypothetical protein [Gammaproteobacteria bacterium]
MQIVKNAIIVILGLLLIPFTAVSTAAVKQRLSDGSNFVFSGGPLEEGVLYSGPEPDWSFVSDIPTIELQLYDPPASRTIWTAEANGKLYVWSGYMGTTVGRMWKQWPLQAERNGLAMLRIDGIRYERQLHRIQTGPELVDIAAAITAKYPSQTTPAAIENGDVWLFEAAPRR